MTKLLRKELKRRGRVWGQQNNATLSAMRRGKSADRRWPIKPQLGYGCGAYITRIPRAL